MKKIKLLFVVCMMIVCAVLSFAGPKPDGKGGRQHHFGTNAMFAMIADDLKLTGEQRTQYEQITAELIEIKKQSWNRKFDEFKSFLQLISKGSASDAEIDEFEQKRTENEFAFQNAIAGKMMELYNILDNNQQKRFIDKMTRPFDNNDKFGRGGHGNHNRGKMPPNRHGHQNQRGKFDKNGGHRMPPKGPHGKPDMSKGSYGRPDMNKAPQGKGGHNHQYGHNSHSMKFSKHSMMLNAVAWELK
ncbi:MAG: Spy/CpxP family protein refolding chaperone, partial [Spirochaetales bacterium]|nr:Spy/CpxP family protein refolding chaperone [Spirochaetales bacterium]